jgi:putative drug exporter of the RND superfamily
VNGSRVGTTTARFIRLAAIPIVLCWVALAAFVNIAVPQLELVGESHAVAVTPPEAPSMMAQQHAGEVFGESDSNSIAMVVLEGDQPLGPDAHDYYDGLVKALRDDSSHVQHVQDLWSDPLTATGSQSGDGKAAYVQVNLAGNMGEAQANASVESVRSVVAAHPPPAGIKVYVTGPAALFADQVHEGDNSMKTITGLTFVVIIIMLLLVYRSVGTVLLIMPMVVVSLCATRGVIALLGQHGLFGLSTFVVSLLTALAIAAGTDYAIFLVGRYQEARQSGEDREQAFLTMYRGTAHVILGSGLTIAGATFCMTFSRLTLYRTMGLPLAIGMLVSLLAALTLTPAVIALGSRFGLLDPKRANASRRWRRFGTAVVRWPGPILVAALAAALVGLLALPGYQAGYNDRDYMRPDVPVNLGYAAADRHFDAARMNPELLLVETDHDLRNPTDFLVIDKIAKALFKVPGVSRVQTITRPDGKPIEHSTIPFQLGMQSSPQVMNQKYNQDRMADLLHQTDEMQNTVDTLTKMSDLTQQMAATTHNLVTKFRGTTVDIAQLRDNIENFDDFLRPLRNYLYWEPHCFGIPVCWSLRGVFDTLDSTNTLTDDTQNLLPDLERLDSLLPQLSALLPPQIDTMKQMKQMMLTMYETQKGQQDQQAAATENSSAMGEAFDKSRNDDTFYLPPEAFDNPDFKRGMKNFISPDGKSVRFIISHQTDPASEDGISRIDPIKLAAKEAIKGTPLEGSTIYLGGTAATFKDIKDGTEYDLMIIALASICLIFVIMLLMTRSVVAAVTIVGTVVLSLGTSFGLSILIWQHFVGLHLHWSVIALSVLVLMAVGSDYNLLLVSRLKEEAHAGLKTGIIRAMSGTGSVVTTAGLVFAVTMMSMVVSDLRVIGQVGTTIGLGLLFDTLIVRSFMTPSIAALLGRWFWWPQRAPWSKQERAKRAEPVTEPVPTT